MDVKRPYLDSENIEKPNILQQSNHGPLDSEVCILFSSVTTTSLNVKPCKGYKSLYKHFSAAQITAVTENVQCWTY